MSGEKSQAIRSARAADDAAVIRGAGLGVAKVATGIPGFDHVAMGGLPRRRATVLAGQAGSAKTVFAGHFLAEGVRRGEPGVFVTLEEPAHDLRANFTTLGWDVAGWEAAGDWAFVDASPVTRADGTPIPYSIDSLQAQIGKAVDATGAQRVVVDSLNTVFALEASAGAARLRLRLLVDGLRRAGLTTVMTVETPTDPGESLSRFGIEEFVADNVVLLRNVREGKGRRRTLEILKMRGSAHLKGDHGFTVLPGEGVVVLPVPSTVMSAGRAVERVTSGVADLDRLTHGGLLRDSIVLVAGPTGTGKTLLGVEFLCAAAAQGRSALLLGFEESPEQIARNAVGQGRRFDELRAAGHLHAVSVYPEESSLEDHLLDIRQLIDTVHPERLVVDSLTALERAGSAQAFREFLVSLTAHLKEREVTTLLTTSTTREPSAASPSHVATLADTVLVLRYVESAGRVDRALTVLKMRGSSHDRMVRHWEIADDGLSVGEPLDQVVGIVQP